MEVIDFDDVSLRLDVIAVLGKVKEEDDHYSYFVQTSFGKLTKYTSPLREKTEDHRAWLIKKINDLS